MIFTKRLLSKLCAPLLILGICLTSIPSTKADDPIKVHVFLHSHMDIGWIYTFEHYYTGTGGDDGGCVRCVLNNVYGSLLSGGPDRKYQIAEVSFFNRWWQEQDEVHKENMRKFVKDNRFEFVNGGWGTNDEACAYYEDIIDQFIIGHRWLKKEFDVTPNVGWHIDSFGHSATQASLFAQEGYDGFFFGRLDYQDWDKRRNEKSLEFNWRPSNPHGESVLGRALYVHYSDTKFMVADNYWCRSIFCNGNLDGNKFNILTNWLKNQANSFKTKNIAILIGDDFHLWKEAEKDFRGIEDMIKHYKENPGLGIEAKFSGLKEYIQEVQQDVLANKEILNSLPEKHGDFFPYVENEWTAWTGYFTSKSMWKHRVRQYSQYYNAAKLLLSKFLIANNKDLIKEGDDKHKKISDALLRLEDALAVCQHHDAVSGTMRENVRKDYDNMMSEGRKAVDNEIRSFLSSHSKELLKEEPTYSEPFWMDLEQEDPKLADLFNNNKKVAVNVFNPGQKDKYLLKVRVPNARFKVLDENNESLLVDIICEDVNAAKNCFLYFVDELPAYSLKSYMIVPSRLSKQIVPEEIHTEREIKLDNEITLTVDPDLVNFNYKICPDIDQHDLYELLQKRECIEDSFSITYEYYESETGKGGLQVASGAYVFNPRSQEKHTYSKIDNGRIFTGHHLSIIQMFREKIRTDVRLVHHEAELGIEVESHMSGVEGAYNGMEIVMVVRSKNIKSNEVEFHTDSNGYYMVKRQKDHNEGYDRGDRQPVAGNYYPITSALFMEDSKTKNRLTIVTDRAQGATSLNPGELEIMLHRITLQDDWKGLSEVLNEGEDHDGGRLRVTARHWIMYSSPNSELTSKQRKRQYKLDRAPQIWFANTNAEEFAAKENKQTDYLDLQDGIKLYIRSYNVNEYIVRIHNLDEVDTKHVDIYNASTKICTLLNKLTGREDVKLKSITELSLFTTKLRSEVKKNKLDPQAKEVTHPTDGEELSSIELVPMEIRTFNIVLG